MPGLFEFIKKIEAQNAKLPVNLIESDHLFIIMAVILLVLNGFFYLVEK